MGSTHETPGRFAPGESGIVGVFGMDLEGLEVVSGCSKRFIWKLTDISMNSCVDLLSPPAWWCGLKFCISMVVCFPPLVTTCVVVWIEILPPTQHSYHIWVTTCVVVWIEIINFWIICIGLFVTTCVVVWIEISDNMFIEPASGVTTCVVVWIEIQRTSRKR